MNYNKVLDSFEPYLTQLAPTSDDSLSLTYLNFPEDLISKDLPVQQALQVLMVLEVPLYWKGTSYNIVSASLSTQREILACPVHRCYGKANRAANLLVRVVK